MSKDALVELKKQRDAEKRAQEIAKKGAYMQGIDELNDDYMRDVISTGLSATKRARIDDATHGGSSTQVTSSDLSAPKTELPSEEVENSEAEQEIDIPERPACCNCPWIVLLSGSMSVDEGGEIEGYSHFSTAKVANCQLTDGRWYYEVILQPLPASLQIVRSLFVYVTGSGPH